MTKAPETREAVYDEQINPLMAQILAICQAHAISMVASFHIPNDEDADLLCTSALTKYPDTPANFHRAVDEIYRETGHAVAVTERTDPDGKVHITVRPIR